MKTRILSVLAALLAALQTAAAHTLDGDSTMGQEIAHQLTGAHHLPLLLIAIAGIALWSVRRRKSE